MPSVLKRRLLLSLVWSRLPKMRLPPTHTPIPAGSPEEPSARSLLLERFSDCVVAALTRVVRNEVGRSPAAAPAGPDWRKPLYSLAARTSRLSPGCASPARSATRPTETTPAPRPNPVAPAVTVSPAPRPNPVAPAVMVSPAPRCSDSMRRWKLEICAREKRLTVCAWAPINPITLASLEGSGRPATVTVMAAAADEPTALKDA